MAQRVLTALVARWNYDMKACQSGSKCLLLTTGGIAVIGQLSGEWQGYMAWSPLPKRDKEKEATTRG
jgi:hypothetical protein